MKKRYIYLNLLIGLLYQPAILFAMSMSISQANSTDEIISNLYWVIPMHIVLGSFPAIILFMIHMTTGKGFKQAFRLLLLGVMLVVVLQITLYIAMFLLFTYGPII
ncbi:hypothetical protein GCM10011389_17210 [Pontibacillus salipaludis]|uniref:Uncharacterized protein n=1 Tax=Pontibacillus salipaludis TaxID=1697394 RepID=A0ABQ1Q1N2_9BACI|nr:hypothetical protein GCM10011389_17210 [Pontibacillus salipaludis]